MTIRDTVQIGDPRLKLENKIIGDPSARHITHLIQDLKDTMHKGGLIGLAAPQIGENYKIFITEPRETDSRPADQADIFRVCSVRVRDKKTTPSPNNKIYRCKLSLYYT